MDGNRKYIEWWGKALADADNGGLYLEFATEREREQAQRGLFTTRAQHRRLSRKLYAESEPGHGVSPWDDLTVIRAGATGLVIAATSKVMSPVRTRHLSGKELERLINGRR